MSSVGRAENPSSGQLNRQPNDTTPKKPRVLDVLRRFTPKFMRWSHPAPQVKNVLSKILLCRTAALKGHVYQCSGCDSRVNVYNSCGDRHCPQCGGARRADWMNKSAEVILPGVPYFQVIFTLPNKLSALILGNRKELYNLLFQSAWRALNGELRRAGQYQAAAMMVLHTWNQQLEHHPHIHALVPGAGPSLDGSQWNVAQHPKHRRRRKPYLTDNVELGRAFRRHYIQGLKRLFRNDKLKLGGKVGFLEDCVLRKPWLNQLEQIDWNVFIQGPPSGKSDPVQVVKYLASYLTGGPINDHRMISYDQNEVYFWARPKRSSGQPKSKNKNMNTPQPYRLSGRQFMQRWALHILPKGYTRSRCYGGYHGSKRSTYLNQCRELLIDAGDDFDKTEPAEAIEVVKQRKCAHCNSSLSLIHSERRPSWRKIFEQEIYRLDIYSPQHHIGTGRSPPHPTPAT